MKSAVETTIIQGMVIKKTLAGYTVQTDGRSLACTLSARLRDAAPHIDPVAIGDEVNISARPDQTGSIVEVLPRRNQMSRRSAVPMPTAHAHEQVIVANVDQVVAVFAAASPPPKWNMLDRYLVAAESSQLPALVCITKLDLVTQPDGQLEPDLAEAVERYRSIGYPVLLVSAVTGEGLEAVRHALHGRRSVLLGKSGVGKSSLLNALQPGLGLRVGAVSDYNGKGRHTTSHLELFPLEMGGAIVDTPGVREFGVWELNADDLAFHFPEMRPHLGRCKFGMGCGHNEEPGCAVRQAVMNGGISPYRYHSYLTLKAEAR